MSATANAINAQLSTGPTTPEGKNAIRFNALKSGLFARTIVLPNEDQAAYEALGAHFDTKFKPHTADERELVLTIQNTTWRLNRAVQLESSLYAIGATQQLDDITEKFGDQPPSVLYSLAQAAGYLANPKPFDQINRQEARLQRTLDRAQRELITLICLRIPNPKPTEPAPLKPASKPAAQPAAQPAAEPIIPPSGFVPSKFPHNMPSFSGPNKNEDRRRWLRRNASKNLA